MMHRLRTNARSAGQLLVATLVLAVAFTVGGATLVGAADGAQAPSPTLSPSPVAAAVSPFTFGVGDGAFCDGTGADGWRAHTFIVDDGVNLATMSFIASGVPGYVGLDFDASGDGTLAAPLHKGDSPGITFTPAGTPSGLINPSDLAGYNFDPTVWTLVDGDYRIGFACTGPTNELRQWWSITVTIDVDASPNPFLVVKAGVPEPVATTVSLGAAPTSATVGDEVTFTANVTPSGAAGSIEFFVGGVSQSTGAVSGGTATWTTSALTAGTKSITATFTPGNPLLFGGSTSPPLSFTVSGAGAQTTSTALTADPEGPAVEGELVTLTANVTPSGAAGAVTFSADGFTLGAPVPVAAGVATLSTTELAVGELALTASFVPTDAQAFTGSTTTLDYTVASSDGAPTAVTLVSDPPGEAAVGAAVTLTATVDPAVPGTVSFVDDGQVLGDPVEVTDGAAAYTTSDLAEGTHSIVAAFSPADAEAYRPSSSLPLTLVVGTPTTSVPDPLAPGGTDSFTDGFTDVAGSGTGSLPVTGVGVGVAGVGLILVYVGRVLYLVGRPHISALRR
ncbi:MAG: Ig-like domain repeat protein [Acidimicrobiales bacterium]